MIFEIANNVDFTANKDEGFACLRYDSPFRGTLSNNDSLILHTQNYPITPSRTSHDGELLMSIPGMKGSPVAFVAEPQYFRRLNGKIDIRVPNSLDYLIGFSKGEDITLGRSEDDTYELLRSHYGVLQLYGHNVFMRFMDE